MQLSSTFIDTNTQKQKTTKVYKKAGQTEAKKFPKRQ